MSETSETINNEKQSNLQQIDKRKTDSYLESLEFITQYYQKNISKDSLVSGVLSHGMKMNLESFLKSSSRIGLITKVVERKIDDISQLALPSLLLLKKERACVLLDIDFQEKKVKVCIDG